MLRRAAAGDLPDLLFLDLDEDLVAAELARTGRVPVTPAATDRRPR
jgi:hypothetical protein